MKKETKPKLNPSDLRKFYAYSMIMLLSILIVICSQFDNIFYKMLSLIILFALQFMVVKGIVDDAYREY